MTRAITPPHVSRSTLALARVIPHGGVHTPCDPQRISRTVPLAGCTTAQILGLAYVTVNRFPSLRVVSSQHCRPYDGHWCSRISDGCGCLGRRRWRRRGAVAADARLYREDQQAYRSDSQRVQRRRAHGARTIKLPHLEAIDGRAGDEELLTSPDRRPRISPLERGTDCHQVCRIEHRDDSAIEPLDVFPDDWRNALGAFLGEVAPIGTPNGKLTARHRHITIAGAGQRQGEDRNAGYAKSAST